MISGEIKFRIRYSHTDKMGYLYYGRYANFYEAARVELFRSLGFSYKKLEDEGIGMPVVNMKSKFLHPIMYDELIKVKTYIKTIGFNRWKCTSLITLTVSCSQTSFRISVRSIFTKNCKVSANK